MLRLVSTPSHRQKRPNAAHEIETADVARIAATPKSPNGKSDLFRSAFAAANDAGLT